MRHSHGATGSRSDHSPTRRVLASCSANSYCPRASGVCSRILRLVEREARLRSSAAHRGFERAESHVHVAELALDLVVLDVLRDDLVDLVDDRANRLADC